MYFEKVTLPNSVNFPGLTLNSALGFPITYNEFFMASDEGLLMSNLMTSTSVTSNSLSRLRFLAAYSFF